MAADCSDLSSAAAFTMVFALYFSADGSRLLILPLVKDFHDGLPAVLYHGWHGGSLVRLLVNGFQDGVPAVFLSGW